MTILVTGATGFLGHHLCKRLIKDGYKIRILKEKGANINLISNLDLEVFEGDIRDYNSVKKAVQDCNIVFHLAGLISYWNKLNKLQYEINVKGTQNIANACLEHSIDRLIYVSSTTTAGTANNGGLAKEKTPYNLFPLKINYCDTKFLAETEVYKAGAKGLDMVIVCPGSIYGAGDKRKIKTDPSFDFKFPIKLFYMNGGIAVIDVEDVVEGMIKAWKQGKKGEKYFLIGENLSFYEIRKTIANVLGKKPPIICIPNYILVILAFIWTNLSKITGKKPKLTPEIARFNKINLYCSNEKAKKELGLTFKPFRESIKTAIKWYRDNNYID